MLEPGFFCSLFLNTELLTFSVWGQSKMLAHQSTQDVAGAKFLFLATVDLQRRHRGFGGCLCEQ